MPTGTMAMIPSVGDILMLSQTAWRMGRAFTQGTKSVPAEFAEVEREADRLSEAIRIVAETLNGNAVLLDQADDTTKTALSTILNSAQRTLEDLESFVARYRIVMPHGERSWSDLVLENYKIIKWTTEGGSISALRDMLYVHTKTIDSTMQSLQSRSLVVDGTLAPRRQSMHERPHSITSDDTVATVESTGNGTRLIEAATSRTSPYYLDRQISRQASRGTGADTPHSHEFAHQWRESSVNYSDGFWRPENGLATNVMDWDFESGAPPTGDVSIGDRYTGKPFTTSVMSSPSSYSGLSERSPRDRMFSIPRRESTTLPSPAARSTEDDAEEGSSREASPTRTSPISHGGKHRVDSKGFDQQLPPPPLPPKALGRSHQLGTPTSVFPGITSAPTRHASQSSGYTSRMTTHSNFSTHASIRSSVATSPNIASERAGPKPLLEQTFEKSLLHNSAILCDARATLIEFAQKNPDEEDPRFDTEMKPVCEQARVLVVRKRENCAHGGTKFATSIWTLSDDGNIRCQQKLIDDREIVPYCSFFEPQKVAVPPTNGEMVLRLHAAQWGDREERDIRTAWINYIFIDEQHANRFQSAIFGRQLLGSFRTSKTTVIHGGFSGVFAFEEQLANIEVLRLWEDDGVNTPGGAGGVMALLHMSGNFGQGYAKWWMNSSRQQVRVKDEHNKFAKLKGIDIRVLRIAEKRSAANGVRSSTTTTSDTSSSQSWENKGKKGPERNVTGIRIEFKTEEERAKFVDTVKRVQERMLPLPDI